MFDFYCPCSRAAYVFRFQNQTNRYCSTPCLLACPPARRCGRWCVAAVDSGTGPLGPLSYILLGRTDAHLPDAGRSVRPPARPGKRRAFQAATLRPACKRAWPRAGIIEVDPRFGSAGVAVRVVLPPFQITRTTARSAAPSSNCGIHGPQAAKVHSLNELPNLCSGAPISLTHIFCNLALFVKKIHI